MSFIKEYFSISCNVSASVLNKTPVSVSGKLITGLNPLRISDPQDQFYSAMDQFHSFVPDLSKSPWFIVFPSPFTIALCRDVTLYLCLAPVQTRARSGQRQRDLGSLGPVNGMRITDQSQSLNKTCAAQQHHHLVCSALCLLSSHLSLSCFKYLN